MKILVTGSKGQLGKSIEARIASLNKDYEFLLTDIEELDICDPVAVDRTFEQFRPDFVINCAAYTAVDKAEEETEKAHMLNAVAPSNLAKSATKYSAKLIHTSTDYVFSGKAFRPYTEDSPTGPEGSYGRSKLLGEQAVLQENKEAIIIRTSWLYSEFGHNFVKTMLRLGNERDELNVVADQIGNPTWAGDLASAILQIIEKNDFPAGTRIFHYSNEGIASWFDLARASMLMAGLDCKVNPIRTEDYPLPAPRPFFSAMEKHLIKNTFDIAIPYWRDSLEKCIRIIKQKTA